MCPRCVFPAEHFVCSGSTAHDAFPLFLTQDPLVVADRQPEYFHSFSCVIATGLTLEQVAPIARICWDAGVPLVFARCNGLIAHLRIATPEHTGACVRACVSCTRVCVERVADVPAGFVQ